jgi:hypothetical protein
VLEGIVLSSLADGCAVDRDVELSPSLFADLEGWLLEGYKGRVLVVRLSLRKSTRS